MPKQIIIAIAATFLIASNFAQDVFAQHYHGHSSHDHGHAHVYRHNGHQYAGGHDFYGDHNYHHDSYDHRHAPFVLGHVQPLVAQVYSTPLAAPPLDQTYGDLDVYCPATGDCPSQYQQPAEFGTPYQGDMAYHVAPYQQNTPPGRQPNLEHSPNHAGHDHGDHAHDGHSHAQTIPSDQGYVQPPSLPPPFPSSPSPKFAPHAGDAPQPNLRSRESSPDREPIRMDSPPPATVG